MRLKEAQILGILALIAVGIIVLCLWGGRDQPEAGQAGQDAYGTYDWPDDEPDLADTSSSDPPSSSRELLDNLERDYERLIGGQEEDADADGADTRVDITGQPPAHGTDADAERRTDEPERHTRPPSSEPPPRVHVVQKGDTLYDLSRKYYNSGAHWKKILDANATVLRSPKDLRPKMKLTIPPLAAEAKRSTQAPQPHAERSVLSTGGAVLPGGKKFYDVQKGDTLYAIAVKQYDDANAWRKILKANADILASPKDLRPGQRLILP